MTVDELTEQLYNRYTAKIYKLLADHDPVYQRALANCGLGGMGSRGTADMAKNPEAFQTEMRKHASYAANAILAAKGLEPSSIRTDVLKGPETLFRVGDQSRSMSAYGVWWFKQKVANKCRTAVPPGSGPNPAAQLDWLRNVLAVCYNWSDFNQFFRVSIRSDEELPIVMGKGTPQPYYSPPSTRSGYPVSLPPDYWKKKGVELFGNEIQIVLPWVPQGRITKTASL